MMSGGDPQRTPRSPRPFCWIWSPRTDSPWSAHMAVLPTRRPGLRRGAHEGDELGAGVAVGEGGAPPSSPRGSAGSSGRSLSCFLRPSTWHSGSPPPRPLRRREEDVSPAPRRRGRGLGVAQRRRRSIFFFFPLVSVLSRTLSGAVWVREVESPPLLYLLTDGGVQPAVKGGAWCVSHRRTGACGVHRVVVALLLCKKDVTLPERAVYLFIFSVNAVWSAARLLQAPALHAARGQDRDLHFPLRVRTGTHTFRWDRGLWVRAEEAFGERARLCVVCRSLSLFPWKAPALVSCSQCGGDLYLAGGHMPLSLISLPFIVRRGAEITFPPP